MPGPYHFALVKPSMKQTKNRDGHYQHEVVVALSENWQDEQQQPLCRLWSVTGGAYEYYPLEPSICITCSFICLYAGGAYPFWFLADNHYQPLNRGLYTNIPPAFLAMKPQTMFIFQNYEGFAQIYCHTPEIDGDGYYAVFESKKYGRDSILYGHYCEGSIIYRGHVKWSGATEVDLLMQNVMDTIVSL